VWLGYRCWSCICVLGISMLVMHLCIRGINDASCICVFVVLMLVLYLCVRCIDVASCICVLGVSMLPHEFVCYGYRCWSCI